MTEQIYQMLEFDRIRTTLADHTLSSLGRELSLRLEPQRSLPAVEQALLETTEARAVLDAGAQVPLWGLADARPSVERAAKGGVLQAGDLVRLADCLRGCAEFKRYMQSKKDKAPNLCLYTTGIVPMHELTDEIYASIDGSRVADSASPRLAKIRKEMRIAEDRIKSRLQSFLTNAAYREALQEPLITIRGDRYALPIKASHRQRIAGTVVDSSGSGMTVFIEPDSVRKLTEDLRVLRSQEEDEEYQVLVALSGLVAEKADAIYTNLDLMAFFDLTFAKGRLSLQMRGQPVAVRAGGAVQLLSARHPLIEGEVVPIDVIIGRQYRTLVITGPNTGGKTVALKTVGLLALMAQAGLHLPVAPGSALPVFDHVLADIGDAQSITQSLSTFSGHISRIAEIIKTATGNSLVLLDEIGTGTDPAEGAALAMAILEDLHGFGCITIASTHYGDVKRLAEQHPGFVNGRMDFDRETLQPLYRLVIGEAGESQALWIAARLGLSRRILDKARDRLATRPESVAEGGGRRGFGITKPPEQPVVIQPKPQTGITQQPDSKVDEAAGTAATHKRAWRLGDSVELLATGERGVVAVLPDELGQMVVFSEGRRLTAHERRVKLVVGAEHLYPEGYDLRTVLFSWNERRTIKQMQRRGTEIVDGSDGNAWVKTGSIEVDRREEPKP